MRYSTIALLSASLAACTTSSGTTRGSASDPQAVSASRRAASANKRAASANETARRQQAAKRAWPAAALDVPRASVPVKQAPAKGAQEPLVQMVVFSDFECPYCSGFDQTLRALMSAYPEDLRITFRHQPMPFHASATPAAEAAVEAHKQGGDAAFWKMHDALFERQASLAEGGIKQAALAANVDTDSLDEALRDHRHLEVIARDQQLAEEHGARGTPTSFINGRRVEGALPLYAFVAVMAQELRWAKQALANGVKRARLYQSLMDATQAHARRSEVANRTYIKAGRSPRLGGESPLVRLVVFSDLECPFCRNAIPMLLRLHRMYGADLQVVWKHLPLKVHPHAAKASRLSQTVYQELGSVGFWKFVSSYGRHDKQGPAAMRQVAAALGIASAKVEEALRQHGVGPQVARDQRLARRLGVAGTPTFYVNGRQLEGQQEAADLMQVVDAERTRANALLRKGIPREDVTQVAARQSS